MSNSPALPIVAACGAVWFSRNQSRPCSKSVAAATRAAFSKIHNMSVLESRTEKRVHIMNFLVAGQYQSQEIDNMNLIDYKLNHVSLRGNWLEPLMPEHLQQAKELGT